MESNIKTVIAKCKGYVNSLKGKRRWAYDCFITDNLRRAKESATGTTDFAFSEALRYFDKAYDSIRLLEWIGEFPEDLYKDIEQDLMDYRDLLHHHYLVALGNKNASSPENFPFA